MFKKDLTLLLIYKPNETNLEIFWEGDQSDGDKGGVINRNILIEAESYNKTAVFILTVQLCFIHSPTSFR